MTPQSIVTQATEKAYSLLECNSGLTLLAALRESSDYNIETYKSAIIYLALKLGLVNRERVDPWPVYALALSEWETAPTTTQQCIKQLLCTGTPGGTNISSTVVHK